MRGKAVVDKGKGAGCVVLRCRLHRKALVWVDWQVACGLGCGGGVAIRVAKRGRFAFLFVCATHAEA